MRTCFSEYANLERRLQYHGCYHPSILLGWVLTLTVHCLSPLLKPEKTRPIHPCHEFRGSVE
ncbi:hypothetical protein NEOLEDRAFT_1131265 [Neolentinus lepideus HHB14362 ss-1]|uniref:Uncharacterized protein n=1 Tax=Neolentinus lepideus HHB14362 ss-1 TaxID=1314782 RepID=A0A165TV59_9AGAM|nr:hypothetical protein NEOLEDRAFT_1131265 [Neolentinus lepideus HHB14362 ss-1]